MIPAEINEPAILSKNLFPVVGVGASAGGLEAFKKLVKAIPEKSGMAYILVQHLHPHHESALPEILQRMTNIPVIEISDNVHVDPNYIYVIPSNKILVATDGVLKLSPRSAKGKLHLPIDIFFSSLAEVHQSHAIGVVLSGNGADGTTGLRNIKEHGGLTIAQDPGSAANDDMPQNAIDAQIVDFILAPEKIPERLIQLQRSFLPAEDKNDAQQKTDEDRFGQILALLKVRVGVDFTFYKQSTIRRRILRRVTILHLDTIQDYLHYLNENKFELHTLFQDLLIPVTSFFRDKEAFEVLCGKVLPEILQNKTAGNPLRLWIAGCSTGQEVYSIAICVQEVLENNFSKVQLQIFATDISKKCIEKARNAMYSEKEMEGVSEMRRHNFFDKKEGHYHVKKPLRDTCVFAVHNLLKDPPFAKIDLVSCRNVLIYFEPFLQKKALATFHYALNNKAFLLLGIAETIDTTLDLFISYGKKDKFYIRKSVPGKFIRTATERAETSITGKSNYLRNKEQKTNDFNKNADDILLSNYTPSGVVINSQSDIVQFRGSTGEYLEPSAGLASLNVMKMAKESLSFEIRNALQQVKTTGEPFTKEGIPINRGKKLVTIEVIPLLDTIDIHYLILFREPAPISVNAVDGKSTTLLKSSKKDIQEIRIQQLEKELTQANADMRSITEEHEAANEELQSSNEELLSGSEELQSLNEELETGKEELQSTNEELINVNQELYNRNEDLNLSRRFAEAIVSIINEPLLVLDNNFIIKSANKSFYKVFRLTEDLTLGKSLFRLQNDIWDVPGLRKELLKIRKQRETIIKAEIVFNFPVIGERIICCNIQLINKDDGEQSILLALDDVTSQRNEEFLLKEKADLVLKERHVLHDFFMQTPALLCILSGPEHIFELANPLYQELIGDRNPVGKKLVEVIPEIEKQGFLEILNKVFSSGETFTGEAMPISIERTKGKPEKFFLNVNYQAYRNTEKKVAGILVFAYDVTEQVMARKQLEQNAEMIQNLYLNAPAFICTLSGPKHIYDLVNPSYQKIFGKRLLTGKPVMEAVPELQGQNLDNILNNVYNTGEIFVGNEVPVKLVRNEGLLPELCYFNFSCQPVYNTDKKISGVLVFGYEVTELVRSRKTQQESDARFRILTNAMPQKISTRDAYGNLEYMNNQWFDYTHKTYEEMKKAGWKNIIHPDDWNIHQQTWQKSLDTGQDFELELRFLCFDGTYHWNLSRRTALRDEKGNIIMWIGTYTDIHEQKLFEEELERQVADGIKLEKQKNDFISMASHELKTPLTTIKGYTQVLQHKVIKEQDTQAGEYLSKMVKQINKLTYLIDDLLDSSKVKEGKLAFVEELFDFNELVIEVTEALQQTTKSHTIKMKLEASDMVFADRGRIAQVMNNLLSNAIKYSPKAKKIQVTTLHKNGSLLIFTVKDFGIGILKENQPHIFKQFYRVNGLLEDTFSGLGLGMFISAEIIKRTGGSMSVKSEIGKGSSFSFSLPLKNALHSV